MRALHSACTGLLLIAAITASWLVLIVVVRLLLSLPVDALLWVAVGLVVFAVVRRVAPAPVRRGRG